MGRILWDSWNGKRSSVFVFGVSISSADGADNDREDITLQTIIINGGFHYLRDLPENHMKVLYRPFRRWRSWVGMFEEDFSLGSRIIDDIKRELKVTE